MPKPVPIHARLHANPRLALDLRREATETTERWVGDKAFALGRMDCARVAKFHLKQFGWACPVIGSYETEAGALRRLRALGAETLADVLDSLGLARVAPAAALIGDLVMLPGHGRVGALCLSLGGDRIKGFHDDHAGLVTMQRQLPLAAWSVMPADLRA